MARVLHLEGIKHITVHIWNRETNQIAISPYSPDVHIYKCVNNSMILETILRRHSMTVSGLDWAVRNNRIITCSLDKTICIWTQRDSEDWITEELKLSTRRAATCVKWSPDETKFVLGTGDTCVYVGYLDDGTWATKKIQLKVMTCIKALDWHPDNVLVAVGSTDGRVRIYSTSMKQHQETLLNSPWGSSKKFGQLLKNFSSAGWVHSVSFSSNGDRLCWVSHNSTLNIADAITNKFTTIPLHYLPFPSCCWIYDDLIMAAGYDCVPIVFAYNGKTEEVTVLELDATKVKAVEECTAMMKFLRLDRQAREDTTDLVLDSVHQNTIMSIAVCEGSEAKAKKVTTVGMDGQLVVWDVRGTLEDYLHKSRRVKTFRRMYE